MSKIKIQIRFIIQLVLIAILAQNAFTQKISFISKKTYQSNKLEPKINDVTEINIKEKIKRKFKNPDNFVKLSNENIEKNYPFKQFNLQDYYREYLKPDNDNDLNIKEESVITSNEKYNDEFNIGKKNLQAFNNIGNENIKYILDNNTSPYDENDYSKLITHDALEEILRSHTQTYTNLLSISLPISD